MPTIIDQLFSFGNDLVDLLVAFLLFSEGSYKLNIIGIINKNATANTAKPARQCISVRKPAIIVYVKVPNAINADCKPAILLRSFQE